MEQVRPSTLWMACFTLSTWGPRWKPMAVPWFAKARTSWLPSNERGFAETLTISQVARLIRATSSMISGQARRIISTLPPEAPGAGG